VEVWANFEAPKSTSRGPIPTLLTSGPMYGPTPASSTSGQADVGGDRGVSDVMFTSTGMKLVLAMVGGGTYCS